jgi:hypothetical protein
MLSILFPRLADISSEIHDVHNRKIFQRAFMISNTLGLQNDRILS